MASMSDNFTKLGDTKKPKCCTKRETCTTQPKCVTPALTEKEILIYFFYFNIFYTALRMALTTKDDPYYGAYVFIWVQLQLFYLLNVFYFTRFLYGKTVYFVDNIKYFVRELSTPRKPEVFMEWIGFIQVDYYLHRFYCTFFLLLNLGVLTGLTLIYLVIVCFFGLFLLGYYSIDTNKIM